VRLGNTEVGARVSNDAPEARDVFLAL
jgi:hypothetical protein